MSAHRNTKIRWGLAAMVGCALAFVFSVLSKDVGMVDEGPSPKRIEGHLENAGDGSHRSSIGKVAIRRAPDPQDSLNLLLSKAQDYQAFAARSMNRPVEGGRFYALWALSRCMRGSSTIADRMREVVADDLSGSSTISFSRYDAQEQVRRQCSAMSLQSTNELYTQIANAQSDNLDVAVRATREIRSAYFEGNSVLFKNSLAQLMNMGDLFFLDDGVSQLPRMIGANERTRREERWLNGVNVVADGSGTTAEQYDLAFRLATCDPDKFCSIDQDIVEVCAFGGFCANGRSDYLELISGGVNRDTKNSVSKVRVLSAKIREAFTAKDPGVFMAKPSAVNG